MHLITPTYPVWKTVVTLFWPFQSMKPYPVEAECRPQETIYMVTFFKL